MKDYYEILGVSRDAGAEEIKRNFRKMARDTHPDANPGDPAAEERFREIAEAYEVLSDPQKRAAYDRGGFIGGDLFTSGASLEEILQQFFGGGLGGYGGFGFQPRSARRRGRDVAVSVQLTLDEAAEGVSREVRYVAAAPCAACRGTGAEAGTSPERCSRCGGSGHVQTARNTFLGSMMTVTECATCRGTGEVIAVPCSACRGSGRIDDEIVLTVDVPGGVDDGTRLRLTGRGEAGERGGPAGDLYVQVRVGRDERFVRKGDDLHHRVELGLAEATLGAEVNVPLIGGRDMDIDIPAGTQPGTVFRIDREGMPRLRRRGRGDLLVEVDVVVPTDLTKEEEDALRQFGEMRGEHPAEARRKRRFFAG